MKKVIRNNIFESNSSSSHSITLSGNKMTSFPDFKGQPLILEGGEFGWEQEEYDDWLTKANYCAVSFMHNENLTDKLIHILKEKLKCSKVILNFIENCNCESGKRWSYIDHQSQGLISDVVGTSKDAISDFIFSDSVLKTDNDN